MPYFLDRVKRNRSTTHSTTPHSSLDQALLGGKSELVSAQLPVIGGSGALLDPQARTIRYLRISLTDRCNYRCTYCMPEEGVELSPKEDILTFEEITRLARLFAARGVKRIRLTGGEPTIRRRVVELVSMLSSIPDIDEVVMTSNGHRFPELAPSLAAAGLQSVNISLDTLDPDRFRELTRRGDLARVIAGIDAALAAGIAVKVNAVALVGTTESELARLCEFAWERDIVVRFIEHMPMGNGMVYLERNHLSSAAIQEAIALHFGEPVSLAAERGGLDRGPARLFELTPSGRRFGVISAMSDHFCGSCNRLRLSSTGDLHTCLGYDDATALRVLLRNGAKDERIHSTIETAVAGKRDGHRFEISGLGGPRKHMVSIGG